MYFSDSVKSIGYEAFGWCHKLSQVVFSDNVTSIGDHAFRCCSSLSTIKIPNSVETIGENPFSESKNLLSVTVDEENTFFASHDGVLFNYNRSSLISFPAGKSNTSFSIPDSVVTIGPHAFSYCKNLSTVTVPDSVKFIGEYAFYECSSLSNISIPAGVKSINDYVFYNCDKLSSITIPDSVTSIGNSAFRFSDGLTEVIIPDSVVTIGEYAFYLCKRLSRVFIPDSVTSIGDYCFKECSRLSSVFYQGSTSFSTVNAFESCNGIKTVCVPPDYNGSSFCGIDVTPEDNSCDIFRKKFNQCFKGSADMDGPSLKRKNATEWEELEGDCLFHFCDNDTGRMSWSECNSSENVTHMCVNGQCVEDSDSLIEQPYVKIELADGIKVTDINSSEILDIIHVQFGIEVEGISIGWEGNEEGYIFYVIIYVKDDTTASVVGEAVKNLPQGEDCQSAIVFCKRTGVEINIHDQSLVVSGIAKGIVDSVLLSFSITLIGILLVRV